MKPPLQQRFPDDAGSLTLPALEHWMARTKAAPALAAGEINGTQ